MPRLISSQHASDATGNERHRHFGGSKSSLILVWLIVLAGCDTIRVLPNPSPTDPNCPPSEVRPYLQQVNQAGSRLTALAKRFQNTNSPQEAPPIIKEADDLSVEVMLWNAPECARELQINLSLAILNLSLAMQAIVDGDMNAYNRTYGVYQIAATEMNNEYQRLSNLVGQ